MFIAQFTSSIHVSANSAWRKCSTGHLVEIFIVVIKITELILSAWLASLAASPSLPGRSSGRAAKPRTEGGEGLTNIALDCVSTDQSDLSEAIRFNFIHDSRGCKPSRSRAISPLELN